MDNAYLNCQVVPVGQGELYESARWLPEIAKFQWVDITRCQLFRWSPSTEALEVRDFPDFRYLSAALPLDASRQIVTSKDAVHLYDWDTNELTLIVQGRFPEDVRFNDGGISPGGTVYLGTMSMNQRPEAGALYRVHPEELVPVISGVGISNGIAWTSARRAYYVDSVRPQVEIVDLTVEPTKREIFATFSVEVEPDGVTAGPDNDLYVALWRGGRIAHIARDRSPLADIQVPATFPTSVALGGPQRRHLFVTTAHHSEPGIPSREGDGSVYLIEMSDDRRPPGR